MEKIKPMHEQDSLKDQPSTFISSAVLLTHQAKERRQPLNELQLMALSRVVEKEIESREAKLSQVIIQSAARGFFIAHYLFRDQPVARDIDFDREILHQINSALTEKFTTEGFQVRCDPRPTTIYTEAPNPDYEYWSEIGYLQSSFDISWYDHYAEKFPRQ